VGHGCSLGGRQAFSGNKCNERALEAAKREWQLIRCGPPRDASVLRLSAGPITRSECLDLSLEAERKMSPDTAHLTMRPPLNSQGDLEPRLPPRMWERAKWPTMKYWFSRPNTLAPSFAQATPSHLDFATVGDGKLRVSLPVRDLRRLHSELSRKLHTKKSRRSHAKKFRLIKSLLHGFLDRTSGLPLLSYRIS
jgi:hypothetical protein